MKIYFPELEKNIFLLSRHSSDTFSDQFIFSFSSLPSGRSGRDDLFLP